MYKLKHYWILKVRDESNGKYTLTGMQIFKHRMGEKAWGIRELTEKGRKTPNASNLKPDDKVLFYLCGKGGKCFIGSGTLDSEIGELVKSVFHEEFLDWITGVTFSSVDPWSRRLPIEVLRGKVYFVPERENYGSYIQGSVTKISKEDYETILREHTKM